MQDGLWLFIGSGTMGFCYMIYSFIYRSRIVLFTKNNIQKHTVMDERLFLKAQLYIGLINGIYILITSFLAYLYQLNHPKINVYPILCLVPSVFHMINYALIFYAERKGYIVKKE